MNWRAAVTDNWHYKISAFLLATLLWVNVTAGERGNESSIGAEVRVQVQDSAWVLVDRLPQVEVEFRGSFRDLLRLGTGEPFIRIVLDSVTGPSMAVDLSTDMVEYDRDLEVTPTSISPGSIPLTFERRLVRTVPIAPRLEATAAPGYSIVPPLVVQPESVTVRGPESAIADLRSVGVRQAPLDDLSRSVTRELPVRLPEGVSNVEVTPPRALVTVVVDSIVERRVTVPVEARGAAAGAVTVEPREVEVTVSGPTRAIAAALEAVQAAVVRVEERPSGPVSLPVEAELPDDAGVTATARPSEVTVRPDAGG